MVGETAAAKGLTAAMSVPAAASGASAPAATTGILATTKAMMLSPIFGIALLGGIIVYEWWKGGKDAQNFQPAKVG